GASSAMILADEVALDTPMDYASVRTLGADLGSASVIVINDSVDVDWVINKTIHFFRRESCGKCTPCRDGTYWMQHLIERIERGEEVEANTRLLHTVAKQIQNKCLCPLGEFSIMAVMTAIERFPADFQPSIAGGKHA
ncbi:MAG: NADH-ubiquinone oxidoreductase-F iron-sulfur binding region domain-containing protein, partial [Anaerolineales bacterium]